MSPLDYYGLFTMFALVDEFCNGAALSVAVTAMMWLPVATPLMDQFFWHNVTLLHTFMETLSTKISMRLIPLASPAEEEMVTDPLLGKLAPSLGLVMVTVGDMVSGSCTL